MLLVVLTSNVAAVKAIRENKLESAIGCTLAIFIEFFFVNHALPPFIVLTLVLSSVRACLISSILYSDVLRNSMENMLFPTFCFFPRLLSSFFHTLFAKSPYRHFSVNLPVTFRDYTSVQYPY